MASLLALENINNAIEPIGSETKGCKILNHLQDWVYDDLESILE